jgi:hypothetical protein
MIFSDVLWYLIEFSASLFEILVFQLLFLFHGLGRLRNGYAFSLK